MLPLDLHVLGLPLAFILSQDQTLHCIYFFYLLFSIPVRISSYFTQRFCAAYIFIAKYAPLILILSMYVFLNNPLKDIVHLFWWRKDIYFYPLYPNFFKVFFDIFFFSLIINGLKTPF